MFAVAIANAVVIFVYIEMPQFLQYSSPVMRAVYCAMLIAEMVMLLSGPVNYRKSLLGTLLGEFGFVIVLIELMITIILTAYMPSLVLVLAVLVRITVLFLWALVISVFYNYRWPTMKRMQPYPPQPSILD